MNDIKGNFRNKFYHTVDDKGRVSLPARYREIISTHYNDQLIITNYDSSLLAYPYDAWVTLEEKYNQRSIMQPEVEIFGSFSSRAQANAPWISWEGYSSRPT